MPPYVPSTLAQAIAQLIANNMAALGTPVTAWQTAISGGKLTPAAIFDGLQLINTYTNVLGGVGYQNGWADFGAGPNQGGYLKDALGFVRLRGAIASGTINTTAFTLPVGYRPNAKYAFPTLSNGAFGAVVIDTNGTVTPFIGSNVYMYLDSVCFFATQ